MNTENTTFANRTERHRYELIIEGKTAGHIAYKLGNGSVDMLHTEVEPRHEGEGLASQLARFALDDARSQGLKVVASCSYIAKYIQRHPEYEDVVRGN
jgi:predicted GNAT family acetyltransferase